MGRECVYDKTAKPNKCYTRPDDGCQIRFTKGKKIGQFDRKTCEATPGCAYVVQAVNKDTGVVNSPGFCYKTAHACEAYGKKKQCTVDAPAAGIPCKYDVKIKPDRSGPVYQSKCQERTEYSCQEFKKKKDCQSWSSFGC